MISINEIQSAMLDTVMNQPVINGIALMSKDGLMIQSALENPNETLISATGAILYHLGLNSSQTLNKGRMQLVFIKSREGYIIVSEVDEEVIMLISTSTSDIQVGSIIYEINEATKRFRKILSS
ncbi:MAG: roadblock/LC7 domain-containing protein [Candidatus Helarchaeota archaeon]